MPFAAPSPSRRPRVTAPLTAARLGLVWAAGGYGKSTVADDLRSGLDADSLAIRLLAADAAPERFHARVREELRRNRRSDALAAMDREPEPAAGFRALADSLNRQAGPLLFVVDDVHHAGVETLELLRELIDALRPEHRVLLLGRTAPPGAEALESRPGSTVLTAHELAFTADEIGELAAHRGHPLTAHAAESMRRATGGWAAAVVLALGQGHAPAPDAPRDDVLARLLGRLLEALDPADRAALLQLAHLPGANPDVAAGVGDAGLLERLLRAGVPLAPAPGGWSELPGPVAEHLATLAPLHVETARAAAEAFVRAGELPSALETLIAAGAPDEAARIVAELPPMMADRLDHVALGALVSSLPDAALAAHPRVLVHLARACEPVAQLRLRTDALERAGRFAQDAADVVLLREVAVERARDRVRDNDPAAGQAIAALALEAAGAGELVTRARALTVLGQADAAEATPASFDRAQARLEQALVLCRSLGQVGWTAQVVLPLAISVHYARGQFEPALARLEEFLGDLPGRSRHRPIVLAFRVDVLIDLGRYAEAESAFDEMAWLAGALHDQRAAGYSAWSRARMCSQRGDAEGTLAAVRDAERHGGDWFAHPTGAAFLGESADLLDRVGLHDLARTQLDRALARGQVPEEVAHDAAAVNARSGDAVAAREALATLAVLPDIEPREGWRLTLLDAYAALRLGARDEAARRAAEAFDAAAALGVPALPLIREPAMARELLALAAERSSAAEGLRDEPTTLRMTLLGDFRLTRGGVEVELAPGRAEALVRFLAVAGGEATAVDAAEGLWPEVDATTGRRRLRNVLNRLPPGVIVRDGDSLRLAPGTEVDIEAFEQAARTALDSGAAGDPAAARRALELYRGELLPGVRDEWVGAPRERLRTRYVELLELLARSAEALDDYDEAQRLLTRAIDVDRFDDRRYLLLAQLLARQGRRGAALDALRRGTEALADLGLAPRLDYARLAERLLRTPSAAAQSTPELAVRDLEAALELVGELHAAEEPAELRLLLVRTLRRVAPADYVAISEMLAGGVAGPSISDPEIPAEGQSAWLRLGHTNPLLQRYLQTHDGRPYRFSDVISRAELELLPLYREFYAPLGVHHQIAFTLPAPRDTTVAVVLSRGDPDFTDRERALLELARPHIIQAYRNVQRRAARPA